MTSDNIAARLLQIVKSTPDTEAVEAAGETATFAELNEYANSILDRVGLMIDDLRGLRVGVALRQSVGAYAALWASLIGGYTFVPVNPTGSLQRNREVLQRAEVSIILTDDEHLFRALPLVEGVPILNVRTGAFVGPTRAPEHDRSDAAYLLFTSGSTGLPKGVPITEQNLAAFVDCVQDLYPLRAGDRVAQTFELTFDLAMYASVVSWIAGATTVDMDDMDKLAPVAFISSSEINVWFSVPSVISLAHRTDQLKSGTLSTLRLSLFCGEAISYNFVEYWQEGAPDSEIVNLYGPTEATIACSHFPITDEEHGQSGTVPIGEPFESVKFGLLDEHGDVHTRPLPEQQGELLITGAQVCEGYWLDQEVTEKSFVYSAEPDGQRRWYRSGDVAKATEGTWEYLGRLDEQVQVLGHRVELREVEHRISTQLSVSPASIVVVPAPSENGIVESLIAFIETGANIDQSRALANLPKYMTPSKIITVAELPLNSNGKVDRKQLRSRVESVAV